MAESKKDPAWADCCEDWGGYMAAKKAKLEEQFQESAKNQFANPTSLFNGIAIFVNGYTNPSADELKRLMMAHGGIYHHYLRSQSTTHLIASNLPYSKIIAYRKAKNPLPLCKPEWITDSIKEGKVLDFRNYLLYSQCTKNQPSLFAHVTKKTDAEVEQKQDNAPERSKSPVLSGTKTVSPPGPVLVEKKSEQKVQTVSNPQAASVIANCTKNPEFLTEFYNNSRLHHISTMGAMFKDYISDLRDKSDGKFPGLESLKQKFYARNCKAGPSSRRDDSGSDEDLFDNDELALKRNQATATVSGKNSVIMHIDMDCFFVSVGLRKHPELRGFPIAVAHAKGNKQNGSDNPYECSSMSEIASCSYEARQAGVKNGMFLGQALKLCPNLKTIKYDFEGYKEVSYALYDTVASYTLNVEAVSCDEMYADCTKMLQATGANPLEFATIIRNEIKEKTGCPVSTGFGENKLQARLATKKAKPDGQCYLKNNDVRSFIRTLSVRDLPGVGYSTSQKLSQMNIKTCADLENVSLYELQREFGKKNGQQLHDMCRGIDNNKLNLEHVRKSVSAEVNYGIRFENNEAAHEFLKKLSVEVSDRLKKNSLKGRCVNLKVLFRAKDAPNEPRKFMGCGVCDAFNKSKNLIAPTDDPVIITREVILLWNQFHENPQDARGIGIQMTKLESTKNKPAGTTLFKFIDKMKEQERVIKEFNDCIKLNNIEEQSKSESKENVTNFNKIENKTNASNGTSELKDENEILLNNEILSEEIRFDSDSDENEESSDSVKMVNSNSKVEEIRKPVNNQSKNTSQLKQTIQPEYFKQVKPNMNRSGKIKMPDIQEIDMKVLIELPEDIRNEILNEYAKKDKSNDNDNKIPEKPSERVANANVNNFNGRQAQVENDITFSQIDPDFLAALPNEMKNEVKHYCDSKKKQKNVQAEEKPQNNVATKGWTIFESEKKAQKNGKLKIGKGRGRPRKKPSVFPAKIVREIEPAPSTTKGVEKNVEPEQQQNEKIPPSLNSTFHFDRSNGNSEHSEILSDLVNCLLRLPISQVKRQIMEWISNNTDVNDVDFLSMTTYLGTLPRKHRITDLFVLLKCLHRCVVERESCVWHETYKKMLKHIQDRMCLEYLYPMMVPNEINCNKCNNT